MRPPLQLGLLLVAALTLAPSPAVAQQLMPRLTPRLTPRPAPAKPKPVRKKEEPKPEPTPKETAPAPAPAPQATPAPAPAQPSRPGPLVPRLTPRLSPRPAPTQTSPAPPSAAAGQPAPAAPPPSTPAAQPTPGGGGTAIGTSALSNGVPSGAAAGGELTDEERAEKKKPKGFYLDVGAGLTFGVGSTHQWNSECPVIDDPALAEYAWAPTCSAKAPLGPVFEGRVGYRFGLFSIEGFGLGAADWSSAQLSDSPESIPAAANLTNMLIGRVGAGGGLGLRMSGNGFVRPSAAVGAGGMYRHVFTTLSSIDGSSVNYGAPIFRGDITFTIGGLVNIGLMAWVEFSKRISVRPNINAIGDLANLDLSDLDGLDLDGVDISQLGLEDDVEALAAFEQAVGDITVFNGPQVFVGPYIGIHLGK